MRRTAICIAIILLMSTPTFGQEPYDGIIRSCKDPNCQFQGVGLGGHLENFAPDGTLVWEYYFSNADHLQHHDIQPMPNGNVLVIAWDRKTNAEAIAAGRQNITGEIWPTMIAEIEPVGTTDGNIVWEWHAWDHLIQDVDPNLPNYASRPIIPELIDINYASVNTQGDWIHENAIDYDEHLDQIVFSSKPFNEFYVIDHSTTTAEAAGHTSGNYGMGGDILYRWGNPQTYDRGDSSDRYFYVIHGVNWIHCGLPGAGHVLAFNNGDRDGNQNDYSSAVEIDPPRDAYGNFEIEAGEPFGPEEPYWVYGGRGDFYGGATQCGAYRLPNGNTLICSASSGLVFEVTEAGSTVWTYDYPNRVARAPRYWQIDLDEFDESVTCMSGPEYDASCIARDTDCDYDVDQEDFARLQRQFGEYVGPKNAGVDSLSISQRSSTQRPSSARPLALCENAPANRLRGKPDPSQHLWRLGSGTSQPHICVTYTKSRVTALAYQHMDW